MKNTLQRIEAEAKVLKLEKELREAKKLETQLSSKPQSFAVSDIKKVTMLAMRSSVALLVVSSSLPTYNT